MPTRKRNEEEEVLHDMLEALKVKRRGLVALREAALVDLMTLTSRHAMSDLARAAKALLERVEAVKDTDRQIATEKTRYDEMRRRNDARN